MAEPTILDSYALLSYFRGEPSGRKLRDILMEAEGARDFLKMSEVNYAEVKYILLRKNGVKAWEAAREIIRSLPISLIPTSAA